jgi:predicted membrane-bound spermidine synthase
VDPNGHEGAEPGDEPPLRRVGLFALAFGSGFAVLTIEIAGARLIAPVFGLSAVPWTAVIGVILAALAVGNHFGGRMADAGRVPLSRILMIAGLSGALPIVGAGFPWVARELFGFIPGAVLSALVLFAAPVACLGAVVPYLVQADTESLGSVGRRAGDMSAAATSGSILGSFLTGFVLLPAMPLLVLLGVTASSLLVMGLLSARLLGGPGRSPATLVGIVAVPFLGVVASENPADTLHSEQTLYSSVTVTEREWADGSLVRELWQNGGSSSAEYVDTGEPAHIYARVSLDMLDPILGGVDDVLILGGGALTLPVAFQVRRPGARVDVVEIDRAVSRLAAEYFEYGKAERPGIEVIHDDARVFLRRSDRSYDVVYLDVFDHLLTVPWTMVTTEALRSIAARLAPGGVFVANVLSPLEGPGTAFLERFRSTLEEVFPESRVFVTAPEVELGATQNLIVMGAFEPGAFPEVDQPAVPVLAAGRPFTDMWAPVEYLQAQVFIQGLRWN